MKSWQGAIIFVTHDRQLLNDVATGIYDLDPSIDGLPRRYGGNYDAYRTQKLAELARWRRRYKEQAKQQRHLEDARSSSYEGLSDEWRPPKGSQKHRRGTRAKTHVLATDRQLQRIASLGLPVPPPPLELNFPDLSSNPAPPKPVPPVGRDRKENAIGGIFSERARATPERTEAPPAETTAPIVELTNPVVFGRLDLNGRTIAIPAGGRLLVVGPGGAGKSTLLKALSGELKLDSGERVTAYGVRIGVVGQESTPVLTRGENFKKVTGFDAAANEALALLVNGKLDPEHVVNAAGLGLLSESTLDRFVSEYSVGQRRRLDFIRALVAAPHLLVLDEPTNHLSIDLADALTQALRETAACVVVATHDRRMRADLADWPMLNLGD
jgi:macrolide transport system ATP-binding/permease protein